jgi:hypothetical protein
MERRGPGRPLPVCVRDAEAGFDRAGAERTGGPCVGGTGGGGAALEPLERAVDGQPLAVLARLALAGRERREALRGRGDAVALAVGEHLGLDLAFGERRSSHGREYGAIRIVLST